MQNLLYSISQHDPGSNEFITSIRSIFSSELAEHVLGLDGEEARAFMNIMDQVMDSPYGDDLLRKRCLIALRKMSGRCGELPHSHMITDGLVKASDRAVNSGGFADVWEGKLHTKHVAIKAFRVYHTDNLDKVKKRFCKEAVTWKWLRHPNILPFLGASTRLFPLCIVSEWMPHGSVISYLDSHPLADRLSLLVDVLRGLEFLHSRHIIHGDLKGDNILINSNLGACLADFGLSSIARDPCSHGLSTTTHNTAGSTRWMAPEFFDLDDSEMDEEKDLASTFSDIYSFSMVVIEVFTGKIPFHRLRTNEAVLLKVISGIRPERPPDAWKLGLFDNVWSMVQRCWHRLPAMRPFLNDVLSCFEETAVSYVPLVTSMGWRTWSDIPSSPPPITPDTSTSFLDSPLAIDGELENSDSYHAITTPLSNQQRVRTTSPGLHSVSDVTSHDGDIPPFPLPAPRHVPSHSPPDSTMSSPEIEVFSLIRSKYLNTLAQNTFNDMNMDRNSIATQQAARAMLDAILQGDIVTSPMKSPYDDFLVTRSGSGFTSPLIVDDSGDYFGASRVGVSQNTYSASEQNSTEPSHFIDSGYVMPDGGDYPAPPRRGTKKPAAADFVDYEGESMLASDGHGGHVAGSFSRRKVEGIAVSSTY